MSEVQTLIYSTINPKPSYYTFWYPSILLLFGEIPLLPILGAVAD